VCREANRLGVGFAEPLEQGHAHPELLGLGVEDQGRQLVMVADQHEHVAEPNRTYGATQREVSQVRLGRRMMGGSPSYPSTRAG
jgi:hypothetical protein